MKTEKRNLLGFLLLTLIFASALFLFCLAEAHLSSRNTQSVLSKGEYTVVLDAGHGGEDGGASSASGILEKDLNLTIAKQLGEYLEQCGIRVIYTRTEDILLYDKTQDYQGRKKILDLAARYQIARACENGVFVSIHMNAFPQTQYSGLQVYYSPHHPLSESLAAKIQKNVKEQLDTDNQRKIKKADSSIYLLDRLEKPAILIECGFLSNKAEAEKLANAEYQEQLTAIIGQSIIDAMESATQLQ